MPVNRKENISHCEKLLVSRNTEKGGDPMFTPDIEEKILAMFTAGYTVNELARIFKRDPSVIRDVLNSVP